MKTVSDVARVLGVHTADIDRLNEVMSERIGRSDVLLNLINENRSTINNILGVLDSRHKPADEVRKILREKILRHEKQLLAFIDGLEGRDEFEKAVMFASMAATAKRGLFLKKEFAEKILIRRPPQNVLKHMGAASVEDLLKGQDVTEVFSALRFLETDEWMHETFEKEYSNFSADDFEEF